MYEILIAGGGIAGLTAALYAARAGCSTLVLEQQYYGGQIVNAPLVENYPGIDRIWQSGSTTRRWGQVPDMRVLGWNGRSGGRMALPCIQTGGYSRAGD